MTKRENSIYTVLVAAIDLFRKNGYKTTSVRQIAKTADVSLGIVNHYFGSKECLGAQILSLLDVYATSNLPVHLSFEADPILYDLVSVRIFFKFMMERGYREFYLDSLRYDFFFNYLSDRPTVLVDMLKRHYHIDATPDDIQLYSRHLPYMMEKTLILKKEEGLFPSIPYEEVPLLICQTAMNRFVPEKDIHSRNEKSKRIANNIYFTLNDYPDEKMILNFVHHFDQYVQHLSCDTHDFWAQ